MDFLPQLPTDNLYKFIAISGLSILGLTIYFPSKAINDYTLKYSEYVTAQEKVTIEVQRMGEEYKELAETAKSIADSREKTAAALNKAISNIKLGKPYHIPPKEEKNLFSDHLANSKRLKMFEYDIKLKDAELAGKKRELDIIASNIKTAEMVMYSGSIIGFILTLLGFILWYGKVQKQQDILLTQQATGPTIDGQISPSETPKDAT